MPKNTQADVEQGMVTPQKPKKVTTNATEEVSPDKTAPLSPQTITIDINERSRPRGIMGMTRIKSLMVVGTVLGLAGGLAYFLLQWFEIPGLEAQIERLKDQVDRLETENNRYEELNDKLNATVEELQEINVALNDTANRLEDTNQQLGVKVLDLEEQNAVFADQNDKLTKTVNDLILISSFLNETSAGLSASLEQITTFLAEQIESNRAILIQTLENTYRQRKDGWNCDYNSVFGGETFVQNYNTQISATDLDRIMDYVSNRVLDELCLDQEDFMRFLELPQYTPLTSNRLNSAMTVYAERAIDYYFPDRNENGLTWEDWADAAFDCEKLPATKRYNFGPMQQNSN